MAQVSSKTSALSALSHLILVKTRVIEQGVVARKPSEPPGFEELES
jgi:hypothetical protein